MAIIHEVKCSLCKSEMEVSKISLDAGNDLCLVVVPRQNCLESEYDKGKEDGKAEAE